MYRETENAPAILFFGNDWAAENRTSSHQIARWLARNHRVYYIECPGLRAPTSSGRDMKKIWIKVSRFLRGVRTEEGGMKVQTLLQIPLHRFAPIRWLNRTIIRKTLRGLMRREKIRRPLTWFMVPHLASVIGQLGERLSVYYCIDDYSALPGVNVEAVRQMDEEMTRKADLVFVASRTLLEEKLHLNPETRVSPHGVDFDHFARAQDRDLATPADTAHLNRPVIGFFGLIERWIDLELVDYLAEQRPQWNFLLIGRTAVPGEELPRRPNIHFIGKRPYDQLPAYGRQFDVAIIPYRLTRQVLHANPIKLREYLATGKPIVSVSTPEIDRYSDVVQVATSRDEFLRAIDDALAKPTSQDDVRRRMERVRSETWDSRLAEVMKVIRRHLTHDRSAVLS
jgi:glycosyltransferase involved in cell wall biosynthesis